MSFSLFVSRSVKNKNEKRRRTKEEEEEENVCKRK
jgi:hypothetical protein